MEGGVVYLGKDTSHVFCVARESGARARWKPGDERSYRGMVNLHLDGLFSVFQMKVCQSRFCFCQPRLDPVRQTASRQKSASMDRAMMLLHGNRAQGSARIEAQLAPEHPATPPQCAEGDEKPEDVWLLQFDSHSLEFREALCDGILLCACREALVAAHRPFVLPGSEAKIFIKPQQWVRVMASLREHELRPYHVIVTSSYEHLIAECLMDVHDFRRPRLKQPMSRGRKLLTIDADSETIGENAVAEVDAELAALLGWAIS